MPDGPPPRTDDILWRSMAETRGLANARDFLARTLTDGPDLTWRQAVALIERAAPRDGLWTAAEFVLDFLRLYLADRQFSRLVDPWATTMTLLPALADLSKPHETAGFFSDSLVLELSDGLMRGRPIELVGNLPASGAEAMLADLGTPDLLVSMPPIGLPRHTLELEGSEGQKVTVSDEEGYLTLVAATRLAQDGEAIFLVAPNFFHGQRGQSILKNLPDLGLHPHAVIEVEQGFSSTGLTLSLLFLRKTPTTDVFVGKLTSKLDRRTLVKNLAERTAGATPALGRLVRWDSYRGIEALEAEEILEAIFPHDKQRVRLSEIVTSEIVSPSRAAGAELVTAPNTVYLPTFANAIVQHDPAQTNGKASSYFALQLDPARADAEYVAAMLNTALGKQLRATWSSGVGLSTIRTSALRVAEVPLIPIEDQLAFVEVQRDLQSFRTELEDLADALARDPKRYPEVRSYLTQRSSDESEVNWVERLPFPLASILRRVDTNASIENKVDHLLRFFEATAEFYATVLLSAFYSDTELFEQEKAGWFSEGRANVLRRADFGAWTNLGASLAKSARRHVGKGKDDPDRRRMLTAFGVSSEAFITFLADKSLWKLLDEAREERNLQAHAGVVSQAAREGQLHRLTAHRLKLHQLTSPSLLEVRLIRPGASRRKGGVSTYDAAALLMGSNPTFQEIEIRSLPALEDELHLVDAVDTTLPTALQLLPFVVLRASPQSEENACYFYNRIGDGGPEFVSHHFRGEPTITQPDVAVGAVLERLRTSESISTD